MLDFTSEGIIKQLSIDCVVFGYEQAALKILLPKLLSKGEFWVLPSGFIGQHEGVDEAAKRILKERTGIDEIYLDQCRVYGGADRNNKNFIEQFLNSNHETGNSFDKDRLKPFEDRFISVSYYALVNIQKTKPVKSNIDESIEWYDVKNLPHLILDHNQMVQDALEALRNNLDRKLIGFNLLPDEFTMKELQELYEAVYDRPFPNNNFQKRILALNVLERLGKKFSGEKNKAPYLYRFKNPGSVE